MSKTHQPDKSEDHLRAEFQSEIRAAVFALGRAMRVERLTGHEQLIFGEPALAFWGHRARTMLEKLLSLTNPEHSPCPS